MSRPLQFFAQKAHYNSVVELLVAEEVGNGLRAYAAPLTLTVQAEADEFVPPTLTLRLDEAQALLDALWHAGIRPTHGDSSPGALGATERHLKDLRTLLFHSVGVKDGAG